VENYFNYFTEIEKHFLHRRGAGLLLSTLDWALIEIWKDAGIPLEAALRGIDAAFDRYDQRPSKSRKVNSLAYCSQEVLAAAEDMKEATVGSNATEPGGNASAEGFEPGTVATYLRRNADLLDAVALSEGAIRGMIRQSAASLRALGADTAENSPTKLEDLERRLTVMEEKIFAVLLASTSDEEIVAIRAEADRDLAAYRRKMSVPQIEQLQKQFVHKRLLEKYKLPRLSLFYM
jgi:hypothetical protein